MPVLWNVRARECRASALRMWRGMLTAGVLLSLSLLSAETLAAKRKAVKPINAAFNAAQTKKNVKIAPHAVHDAELMAVYSALAEGKLSIALTLVDALVQKAPTFSLAHLLRADILNAKASRPPASIAAQDQTKLFGFGENARRMTELRAEAQLRLLGYQHPPQSAELPSNLVAIAPSVPRVVVVDALRSRLYVYENSAKGLVLSRSIYITQGRLGANKLLEGDQKTPIGVYFSDGAIEKKLPDLYGFGALNTDYPNAWDKKQNRTGHGIWLHGTPKETYARAPYASDGCVVMANPDIAALFPLISPQVPVVLAENLRFVPAAQLEAQRSALLARLEGWRSTLGVAHIQRMKEFYAADFAPDISLTEETKDGKSLLDAWLARKAALATAQAGMEPKIVGLTAIVYPNETDLMHTRFELHYPALPTTPQENKGKGKVKKITTNQKNGLVLRKTLYWKKTDGQWFITLETVGVTSAL